MGQPPKGDDKEVGQIPNVYLGAVGCPVVLTKNQCVFFKLNNGARGTVVAHLYEEGKKPPELPDAVVCDFPDYNGPTWLQGQAAVGRETWIPIPVNPSKHKGDDGCKASRKGLPLRAGCAAHAVLAAPPLPPPCSGDCLPCSVAHESSWRLTSQTLSPPR